MHTTTIRRARSPLAIAATILLVTACGQSAGGGGTWTAGTVQPTPSAAASGGGSPGASGEPGQSAGASGPAASAGASEPAGSAGASAPATSAAPSGAGGTEIALEETATLQITRDGSPVTTLEVVNGETYTFSITNTAGLPHNFYIGPPDRLAANDVAGLPGVPDFTEGTQQFEYTVTDETASLEFACTVPGHYPSMHGTFSVTE